MYYQNPANFNKKSCNDTCSRTTLQPCQTGLLVTFLPIEQIFTISMFPRSRCSGECVKFRREKKKNTRRECFSAILFSVENFISRKSHPRLFCFFLVFKSPFAFALRALVFPLPLSVRTTRNNSRNRNETTIKFKHK